MEPPDRRQRGRLKRSFVDVLREALVTLKDEEETAKF